MKDNINTLLKTFFSSLKLDSLTKEKTLELLNAFQDFVVKSDLIDEESVQLDLFSKLKKKKKREDFETSNEFKHIYTRIVFPEDLNSHNTLFGGKMLAWLDSSGALACNEEGYILPVTVEIKDVFFLSSPEAGDVVKYYYQVLKKRRASMWIRIVGINVTQGNKEIIDAEMRFCDRATNKNFNFSD